MQYDVIIVGAGTGGVFAAYELMQRRPGLKVRSLKQAILCIGANAPLTATRSNPALAARPAPL